MQRQCVLQWGNQTLPLIVVEKAGTSLFALDWIKAFKVDVNYLLDHNTSTTLPSTIDCNVVKSLIVTYRGSYTSTQLSSHPDWDSALK